MTGTGHSAVSIVKSMQKGMEPSELDHTQDLPDQDIGLMADVTVQ